MQNTKVQILISASLMSQSIEPTALYEFIINDVLNVKECIMIEQFKKSYTKAITEPEKELNGLLFELNHVRVNPTQDNEYIINCIIDSLQRIGVMIENKPSDLSANHFSPLGEVSSNVRFYLDGLGKLIFLSPTAKPRLVNRA